MGKEKNVNVIYIDNIKGKGQMLKVGRRKITGRVEGSVWVLIIFIYS